MHLFPVARPKVECFERCVYYECRTVRDWSAPLSTESPRFPRPGILKRLSFLMHCCARASQVFEPSILIDPAELRSESSVERLEQANKYLKEMAYKKVRVRFWACDDWPGCKYQRVHEGRKRAEVPTEERCSAFQDCV